MEKDSLIEKSLKLVNNHKFDDALKILEEIKTDDYKSYFLKGTIYLAQNKLDQAEKNLISASTENNKNYLIFHNLGLIYQTKGVSNLAKENFLKAISINENIETLSELGKLYLNENNFDEAEKYFQAALKKDEDHRRTNIRLGNLYLKKFDNKKGWSYIFKGTGVIRFKENNYEIVS
tara:strand:+ start:122 stop:652 length:531 start_codon:yes stop_codon:yes gene_type:complete